MSVSKTITRATHIIFDLDGTLIDTENLYEKAMVNTCAFYKKDLNKSLLQKVTLYQIEYICKHIMTELKINVSVETFIGKYRSELEKIIWQNNLMPGATKLIRHLQHFKVPMGLISSSDEEMFNLKIKMHHEFFKSFKPIVLGSDPQVKNIKPAPDLYKVCCRRFSDRPSPDMCLVFEDTPDGVEAALAARMQVILVSLKYLATQASENATVVITNLKHVDLDPFGLPPLYE